jgi:hypothetical protein
MKSFLLSSLIALFFIIFASCSRDVYSQYEPTEVISAEHFTPVFPDSGTVIYKTGAEFYGHYLSGLLVIKSGEKDNQRILFTTEMGVKLFDFGFEGEKFKVNYCLDKLNKKPVINLLKNDFILMLGKGVIGEKGVKVRERENLVVLKKRKEARFYYLSERENLPEEVKTYSLKGKEKVVIIFERAEDIVPSRIIINHKNLMVNMKMDLIKK